jgi:protein-S-isoprenylcysteine O-methyltransferase Ste14
VNETCFHLPKKGSTWASMWIEAGDEMNLVVSAVALALGVFAVVAPKRAAAIWGSERLAKLAPPQKSLFVQWYRAFGVILCLAAILFALDSISSR